MVLFNPRARLIPLKTKSDLVAMRKAGRLAARALEHVLSFVAPGVTTQELDDELNRFAREHDAIPAPLGYKGFPRSICTSINEVICHGIPSKEVALRSGDVVGVDVTLILDGFHGDTAATVPVGEVSQETQRLLEVSLEALVRGVRAVRPGGRLGAVGHAVQSYAEPLGYGVVREFVGHGIGRRFHEPPHVPHFGRKGEGVLLQAGMTFTVEPMINQGTRKGRILDDGWTAVTLDGRMSAQFEHTIAVTPGGVEILTVQNDEGLFEVPGRARI
ncbi:MAG: type I methionyl aminopeptidase [Planctomycetota bacterium]|jgi:methionyl aminopeptidase